MRVLVTGAKGFVGQGLCRHLVAQGYQVFEGTRHGEAGTVKLGDLSVEADITSSLKGVECLVHLAAIAGGNATEKQYFDVNRNGALNLARQAMAAGVKRFVFISSVKVSGEESVFGQPLMHTDVPQPEDAYGCSKHKAEVELVDLCAAADMELVVVRPPIIYGHGMTGNLGLLAKLVDTGIPVPFGCVKNERSMIALANLVDFIALCLHHPEAANQTFLVADDEVMSTPDLIRVIAQARGKSARILPFPVGLLVLAGRLTGKAAIVRRLVGSLRVDTSHACETLGWRAPYKQGDALAEVFGR